MDRRAVFFVVAAVACLLMVPVGLPEYRTLAMVTAGVYLLFALVSFLDFRSRGR